jgi:hypothetical protein
MHYAIPFEVLVKFFASVNTEVSCLHYLTGISIGEVRCYEYGIVKITVDRGKVNDCVFTICNVKYVEVLELYLFSHPLGLADAYVY